MFKIFALKEMQMKTTMRFHLTPVRMIRKQATAHKYVEEKELIYTVGGIENYGSHYGNQ
jgi:hypothetical protein